MPTQISRTSGVDHAMISFLIFACGGAVPAKGQSGYQKYHGARRIVK
jgi:hypothetical protein